MEHEVLLRTENLHMYFSTKRWAQSGKRHRSIHPRGRISGISRGIRLRKEHLGKNTDADLPAEPGENTVSRGGY